MGLVKVFDVSEIPAGSMKMVSVEEKEILIANVGGAYYAIGDRCTHMGADLSKGQLSGDVVTCPRHGARFDVKTGKAISGPRMLGIQTKTGESHPSRSRSRGTVS